MGVFEAVNVAINHGITIGELLKAQSRAADFDWSAVQHELVAPNLMAQKDWMKLWFSTVALTHKRSIAIDANHQCKNVLVEACHGEGSGLGSGMPGGLRLDSN